MAQLLCSWMKTLGTVVDSHSANCCTFGGDQKGGPPLNVKPSTASQCLSAGGSLGLLVAGSSGHLAMAPIRDPKFEPSRSGFSLTLNTVPTPNVVAGIPCCAPAAAPAISTPHSTYFPSGPLASPLRSGAIRMKCSSAWLACATNCLTTPVNVTVLVWSYMANEWCAETAVSINIPGMASAVAIVKARSV